MAARRPFGVTLVALFAWITGVLQIVTGILALFGGAAIVGLVAIAVGAITILVSLGLFGGSRGSRILVTIVFIINIAGSIALMITGDYSFWTALGSAFLPVIALILLYTGRANSFFGRS
ncbi:glucan phosphoethanolaminetransferase (alkaline phosphatase superfamily) [Microbacterium halimionae]|uniref:Glucan phosphoethanolaminetransferase (Alkaline phosphatase superfamily) n=1 Tax=Microbacterium halimionae TaxID=1526413 RepID=A0A7W3PLH7_9MICO|nr:hypothetical protein [Microbacterium halimionae]MBA8815864.1 glucan phosphoethanolaminetransferase (alkaline phosphatase superfamily) [Microbacterium halimionae]NII95910.1 glucan phosphoethanolaminetransferase (alkaline phosphatase superfamily) [Microbacterium halimionae]